MWSVERVGLVLFAVAVCAFASTASYRQTAVLFLSVSFQTNLMGVVYFAAIELGWLRVAATFQMLSFVYLGFVALFWAALLGGRENNWPEYAFNCAIHYGTFVAVALSMRNHKLRWPSRTLLLLYPLSYWWVRPYIDAWIGWTMYPFNAVFIAPVFWVWEVVCASFIRPE